MAEQMFDIAPGAGEEIVHAQDFGSTCKQALA